MTLTAEEKEELQHLHRQAMDAVEALDDRLNAHNHRASVEGRFGFMSIEINATFTALRSLRDIEFLEES